MKNGVAIFGKWNCKFQRIVGVGDNKHYNAQLPTNTTSETITTFPHRKPEFA